MSLDFRQVPSLGKVYTQILVLSVRILRGIL